LKKRVENIQNKISKSPDALRNHFVFILRMYSQVFIQVSLLSEPLAAVSQVADERTLASVRPQVVQKVVFLPELHVAPLEIALH